MKHNKKLLGAALISGLLFSTSASAALVFLNASQDMNIYSSGNVNGAGQGLFVGQNGVGVNQRGMIQFDLSSLAGATINSVSLLMHVNAQGYLAAPTTVSLHTITASWTESTVTGGGPTSGGGSGGLANPGDATWTTHSGAINPASTATNITGIGSFVFSGSGLISDVQSWVSGGANNGWMLIGNEVELGSSKRFSSSENVGGSGTWVPVLSVDYTAAVVPVPAAVWLFGSGLIGLVGIARRRQR